MKIKTTTTVSFDLEKAKRRVLEEKRKNGQHLYNEKEREFLTKLYVMFGRGEIKECLFFAGKQSREMRELIECEVWEALWNFNMGSEVKVEA